MPILLRARVWRRSAPGRANNRRHSKAGSPLRKLSPALRRSLPWALCRGPPFGLAIALLRRKSSSGTSERSAYTIASRSTGPTPTRRGLRRGFIHERLTDGDNQPRRTLLLTGASRGIG